ncbi:MAG TPA: YIP1 family protein [Anaerolineales bacterium]|nr:YIP1 family protein [Anaerolineales bacterium]
MWQRIAGVFRFRVATFEEIERDPRANGQALLVVSGVALITGLGYALGASLTGSDAFETFILTVLWTYASWLLWGFITYVLGTRIFGGIATFMEMLRVTGFAYAPLALAIIPFIGGLVGAIWTLAGLFLAVRQGLDIGDAKAFFTVLAGFVLYLLGIILSADVLQLIIR